MTAPVALVLLIALVLSPSGRADVIHVDGRARGVGDGSSWDDAFTGLQGALALAVAGDEVWVALGVYVPDEGSGDVNATYRLRSGVALLGGFAGTESSADARRPRVHVTVLSGDVAGDDLPDFVNRDDNVRHVVRATNVDDTALLDGFVVRGGHEFSGGAPSGGGFRGRSSSPVIRRCTFTDNASVLGGGAIVGNGGTTTFIDCRFTGNEATSQGGGLMCDGASAVLVDCWFGGNRADSSGGGLYAQGAGVIVDAVGCVFSGNDGRSFGGGGAKVAFDGLLRLEHCTFAGNTSLGPHAGFDGGGAGLYVATASAVVERCVFFGNTVDNPESAHEVQLDLLGFEPGVSSAVGSLELRECCLEGPVFWFNVSHGDGGNFTCDPLFVDARGADGLAGTLDDDLSPGFGSTCVDAFAADVPPDGDRAACCDLAGTPRVLDGDLDGVRRADLGALEYTHGRLSVAPVVTAGERVTLEVDGTGGLAVQLLVGVPGAGLIVEPWGAALVDLTAGWMRTALGSAPLDAVVQVPQRLPPGMEFTLQLLTLDGATGFGSFGNRVTVRVGP